MKLHLDMPSSRDASKLYSLDSEDAGETWTCTCPGFTHRQKCKHVTLAREATLEAEAELRAEAEQDS
jgi:hypothetical protein